MVEKGELMSLFKLSGMRQMVQEVLKIPVDLITTEEIEEDFSKEIARAVILLNEEWRYYS